MLSTFILASYQIYISGDFLDLPPNHCRPPRLLLISKNRHQLGLIYTFHSLKNCLLAYSFVRSFASAFGSGKLLCAIASERAHQDRNLSRTNIVVREETPSSTKRSNFTYTSRSLRLITYSPRLSRRPSWSTLYWVYSTVCVSTGYVQRREVGSSTTQTNK